MQLQRRGPVGSEIPVVFDDEMSYDLPTLTPDIDGAFLAADGAFLAADGIGQVRKALLTGKLSETDVASIRIGAPIMKPSALVCIG